METFIEIKPAAHIRALYLPVFYNQDGKVLVGFNTLVTSTKNLQAYSVNLVGNQSDGKGEDSPLASLLSGVCCRRVSSPF